MARVAGLVAVFAGLVLACSSGGKSPTQDAGRSGTVDPSGNANGNGNGDRDDGGTSSETGADAGVHCRMDDDCAVYGLKLRCNEVSGECVPGKACNDSSNCGSSEPDDYCSSFGPGCRCVPEAGSGSAGVCRRRRGVCDPCTADSQCGN